MSFNPPRPTDQLAGCMWLPRILYKARAHTAGTLPPDYARAFGAAPAVDGTFLGFFGLTIDQILAAPDHDEAAASWFLAAVGADRIAEWNAIAPHLGRPGYPMEARYAWARENLYAHSPAERATCIFEVLDADEGR
jgi:hypothetical protein